MLDYSPEGFHPAHGPGRDEISLLYYDVAQDAWDVQASLVPYPSQVAGIVGDKIMVHVANYSYSGHRQLDGRARVPPAPGRV